MASHYCVALLYSPENTENSDECLVCPTITIYTKTIDYETESLQNMKDKAAKCINTAYSH